MHYHHLKANNSASSHLGLYDKIQPSYFLSYSIMYVQIIAQFFKPTHQPMTHTSWQKIAGCLAT